MSIISNALKKAQKEPQENQPSSPPKESSTSPLPPGERAALQINKIKVKGEKLLLIVPIILTIIIVAAIGLTLKYKHTAVVLSEPDWESIVSEKTKAAAHLEKMSKAPPAVPPRKIVKKQAEPATPVFTLSGIIFGEGTPLAIINQRISKESDIISGARLIRIYEDRVELKFNGKLIKLELQ